MRFLLDTRCWLWLQASPERLAGELLDALADPSNEIFLSAASAWEIALKHSLGKLPLPSAPETWVPSRMARSGTLALAVDHAHALRVATLPRHHRDPFDRILVAQAELERLTIVTADRQLEPYDVSLRFADEA